MFRNNKFFIPVITLLLLVMIVTAIALGAVNITLDEMGSALKHLFAGQEADNVRQRIHEGTFLEIRLPRVLLCAITGAVLAVSGVLMQGLFRNPVVEPGLAGTSAGAAFGASFIFVMGPQLSPALKSFTGPFLVPLFAFAGGLLATWLVYSIAKSAGKISVISLLLVGLAINAVGISGTGFMTYIARDPQARSITFWSLGNFSGASWLQVIIVGITAVLIFLISFRYAGALNALMLGEEEAAYAGVNTEKLKKRVMILNTAMVSIATAFVGVISFMGLIVPHVMRLLTGSDHKKLLPASMITGALLLTLADLGARLILAPAEMPIGILTSLVGAPVFIILLKKTDWLRQKTK